MAQSRGNGSKQKLTLFVLTTAGDVYPGWLAGQLERVSLDKNISYDLVRNLASMFPGITPKTKSPDSLSRAIRSSELEPKIDTFMDVVRQTVMKITGQDG